jgi:hypothetical protein
MASLYFAANGPAPTTAAQVPVTTGTAIKTLLQVATPSTTKIRVVSWGVSFDGSAAATPGRVELFECSGAATVTSLTPTLWGDPGDAASLCVGGTSATGYTATAEGTPSAVRMFDVQLIAPTSQYVREFSLGREPEVAVSKFVRIRVTFAAAVNAYAWIVWEE